MTADVRHMLIVKTSSMGDIVHSFPMVSDLSRRLPEVAIDWVVEEAFESLPTLHPAVRRVIPVALRRWRQTLVSPSVWREARSFSTALRARQYDVILDNQGLLKSGLLAKLARGPVWGADRASARETWAAWFYQKTAPMQWDQHAVARNRELAARLFGYAVPTDHPDYGLPADAPCDRRLAICLHATSRPSKLWPEESWRDLVRALVQLGFAPRLPYAGHGTEDERRAMALASVDPAVKVVPPLTLDGVARLLRTAAVVVGVDTGLVHLAAAYGRPTVAIYVDTDPALNGVVTGVRGQALNVGGVGGLPRPSEVIAALQTLPFLCR